MRGIGRLQQRHGVALIIVISVLAIMAALAVAFLVSARMESLKASNFKESMKAKAIADAGIEHAKALLREDKGTNYADYYQESWHTAFVGGNVDNTGDGTPDARWIDLVDAAGVRYGRYAVTVIDEASKANVNTAGYHNENPLAVTQGWSPFEVSLSSLFGVLGCSRPDHMRDQIISARYNFNYPGVNDPAIDDNNNNAVLSYDGIDNDADGEIDEPGEGINEPAEFNPYYPYGDDVPFSTIYSMKKLSEIKPEFSLIEQAVTTHAADKNIGISGMMLLDINHAEAGELLPVLAGVSVPAAEQIVANLIDFRDDNHRQTVVVSPNGTFYGTEAVRINELMIKPVYTFHATEHTNASGPGGNWVLTGDTYYTNANPEPNGMGGIWWFDTITPGTYYLRLYGTSAGQTIGDVQVGVTTQVSMKHGDYFIHPITVGQDGRLKITIFNAEVDKPGFVTYFYRAELSQQPDGEYIELMNASFDPIDIGNWQIEGLRNNDLIGVIPEGTVIGPFEYLVLAADVDDTAAGVPGALRNNGISFADIWNGSGYDPAAVVQLAFSDDLAPHDDVLNDTPSAQSTVIVLKDAEGYIVDQVRYHEAHTLYYRSAERDDPLSSRSSDTTHIFDQWNYSDGIEGFMPQGTPTLANNNINTVGHMLVPTNTEAVVRNKPFATIGDLFYVSTGEPWSRVSLDDMKVFAAYTGTSACRLEAEGHWVSGGGWQAQSRPAPKTPWYISTVSGDEGIWRFTAEDRIQDGLYQLYLYGNYNGAVMISIRRADGSWTDKSPPLQPGNDGGIRFGVVDIGGTSADATPSKTLEIQVTNASELGTAAFDYVILAPPPETPGRVNINTASIPVLRALPGVTEAIATAIYSSTRKPYGTVWGIGDLLDKPYFDENSTTRKEVFRQIANLITVKSDVYEIIVTAETFHNNKKTASEKIRTVVER